MFEESRDSLFKKIVPECENLGSTFKECIDTKNYDKFATKFLELLNTVPYPIREDPHEQRYHWLL